MLPVTLEGVRSTRQPLIALALCAVTLAGCAEEPTVIQGRAVSMRYDPNRVAGLPADDGPSGALVREAPSTSRVENSDGGAIDQLAMLAVEDVEDYWDQHYTGSLPGRFSPVSGLVSMDPETSYPEVCNSSPSEFAFNAAYCVPEDVIAWDRVGLLPTAQQYFGELSVNGLLAHEYGHALQHKAGLVDRNTPTLVSEQQADCFSGAYLRWVAEGDSPRFTINTTEALDKVLAGAIAIRDRPPSISIPFLEIEASHGTALDRVGAFQQGFDIGPASCAGIDMADIRQRRGGIPASLFDPSSPSSDMGITPQMLSSTVDVLNQIFTPANPPTIEFGPSCATGPAAYCPETNTIGVDVGALAQIGTPADESQRVLLQGDNSAISVVTSRYVLALQQQQGAQIEGETAAMRTACLTGVAQSRMADPSASNNQLVLSAGDLDEAVSGLLTNGIVASDVNAMTVPSGFTRILAFRSGLAGDLERCYERFPDQ
ncbi:MAG: peptidase [Mycolicibacterium sp.]|nr:peptidase [Mycolicibacterium sp.]